MNKRKELKPTHIGVSAPDSTGAVTIHFKEGPGKKDLFVHLSASERSALGSQLISGPPLEMHTQSGPALYVSPARTRAYLRTDGDMALELQLSPWQAIHILLQGLHADALALQIQEVRDGKTAPGEALPPTRSVQ